MKTKIEPPFIRTEHNYDRNQVSRETALACPEPTLAQQQFKEESDINFIAERYRLTGEAPQITGMQWGEQFVGTFDFQDAQNQLVAAREAFMELPARTRARFQNDPHQLISFLEDPDNRLEAEKLGLVKVPEKAPESTVAVPAVLGKGDPLSPATDASGTATPNNKTDTK